MKKRKLIRIGLIIIIIGISLISYEYFLSKRNYAFDYMNNKLYLSSSEMPEYLESNEDEEEWIKLKCRYNPKKEEINEENQDEIEQADGVISNILREYQFTKYTKK